MSFGLKLFDILTANATAAKSYINRMLAKKQDKLTFDSAPTTGSSNPVTSDGIRKAIDTATPNVDFSNYPTKNGTGATGTWPISISGAATKASQDSNGKVITDTYLKKAGDTATGDITAPNFVGHLKGNADTATNADKLGTLPETSFLRCRGRAKADGEDTLWGQIGIKEYDKKRPEGVSGTYNYGAVVSLPSYSMRLDVWYNHRSSTNGDGLWYRSGYSTDKQSWARLLDSVNYTKFAPTLTGSGASGTWGINITGNAATATTATTATKANSLTGSLNFPDIGDVATSNKISWNGSTDGADIYYQTTASGQENLVLNLRDDANCYLRIAYNGTFKSYFSPADGNFHGNVNGNADTATKATTALNIPTSDIGGNIWIA